MKLPPTRLKEVLADAFRLVSDPFEIPMPGLDVLPRIRLRLLLPKAKLALPLIERFGPAET